MAAEMRAADAARRAINEKRGRILGWDVDYCSLLRDR